ncbi:THAP domain-containing protein 2-like [Lampris incognitus]|uniref:THAP domain-containing protein 2-like n=1 Tax=Lampris incognitus TaxID=2546036 RepID=UPI0024B5FB02|nr:THAP domain-containing protein 2-like [Lampris incognitus]
MPQACAAFGCLNRRNVKNRQRGITFHKFPKNPGLRNAWAIALGPAVRRKDYEPTDATFLCSCHFNADDFDRTGQTVYVKECVIPSVFASFPDDLKKLPNKARSTRTSTQAGESSDDPVSESPDPQNSSTSVSDHHYALDPDQVKYKLAEAEVRVEELQRQLRNAEDRERRQKQNVLLANDCDTASSPFEDVVCSVILDHSYLPTHFGVKEVKELKTSINKRNKEIDERFELLEQRIDDLEQYSRADDLIISGLATKHRSYARAAATTTDHFGEDFAPFEELRTLEQ